MSYRVIGDQARSLHDAMLSGLNVPDLQQLTRHELNERPGTFRPDGALSTAVFNPIQWAGRQGRAEELSMAFTSGGFAPVEASPARLDRSERRTPEPGLAARGMCPAGRPPPAQIRAGVARSDFPSSWIRTCQT